MQTRKNFLFEILIKFVIAAGIIAVFAGFINSVQNSTSQSHQYEDSRNTLVDISNTLHINENTAEVLTASYHKENMDILYDLVDLMDTDSTKHVFDEASDGDSNKLNGLIGKNFAMFLFLTDGDGNVIRSVEQKYNGKNLCDIGFFTKEQFSELLTSPPEGVDCIPGQGNDDYCFYAAPKKLGSRQCYLIIGNTNNAFKNRINSLNSLDSIVKNVSLGEGQIIFAINPEDGKITYCSLDEMQLAGEDASKAGFPQSFLSDNGSATLKINGTEYFCTAVLHSNKMLLVQAVSTAMRYNDNCLLTIWAIILLSVTLIIAVHYEMFLPGSPSMNRKHQKLIHIFKSRFVVNVSALSKAAPLLVLGLTLIFSCIFYCRTILKLSWVIDDIKRPMNQLSTEMMNVEREEKDIREYCDQMYLSKAQIIANLLEIDPSCLNDKTSGVYTEYTESGELVQLTDSEGNPMFSVGNSGILSKLCDENDIKFIRIFNERGYSIVSSNNAWYFRLSRDSEEQTSAFYDVIIGKTDYLVQNVQDDDGENTSQYIGAVFHYYTTTDDNGRTHYVSRLDYEDYQNGTWDQKPITEHRALLQCAVDTSLINAMTKSLDIGYIMKHVSLTNGAYMVVFDNSPDHKIVYTPNEQNMGKTAAELNVSDAEFSGTFNGFQTVQGVKYFECCRYEGGYYVAIATPLSSLYATRLPVTVSISTGCLFVMLLIMGMFSITSEENMNFLTRKWEKAASQAEESALKNRKGSVFGMILSGWENTFDQKTAEEKITVMIHIFITLIGLYFILNLLCKGYLQTEGSLIQYIFSDSWEHSFNIFAFTKSAMILICVLAAVEILSWFVKMTFSVFNSNTETIANLLLSFAAYGSVITAIFYCLYLFGMQPVSLLASAGVLSLVIGLGAQSLIGDMIASIFTIFERTFRVGDYICVNGTYGTVKEIGIRTTKIQDLDNNIVIFNNSQIKDVTNLSLQNTCLRMVIHFTYEETLERIEKVLSEELPLFKKKIPKLLDGPTYNGVSELNENSIGLSFNSWCIGKDSTPVTNALNREFLLMFERNNLHIPYDYITFIQEDGKTETKQKEEQR